MQASLDLGECLQSKRGLFVCACEPLTFSVMGNKIINFTIQSVYFRDMEIIFIRTSVCSKRDLKYQKVCDGMKSGHIGEEHESGVRVKSVA